MMKHCPVITGLGIVSPIGVGTDAFWRAAVAGRSGIGSPTRFDPTGLPHECQIVAEVRDFDVRPWMAPQTAKRAARFSQFAVAAAKMASIDSRLEPPQVSPELLKVAIGTSLNGQIDVAQPNYESFLRGDDIWPWACLEFPAHAATSHVAIATDARAQTMTFGTACAAGLDSIAWAAEEVRRGVPGAVIAGASETPLSAFILKVFHAVGVLSKWPGPVHQASRPFDWLRSGIVLAEGAAAVTVEEATRARMRGAPLYAEILSYASATEGQHLRKVDETGETLSHLIATALAEAQLAPHDIDYICAHGNSLPDYDAAETTAIKRAFGRHAWSIPISSTKSMCGQALAASSAIQVVAACLVLRHQVIPPTINYEFPDPDCDLDYVPNTARAARVRTILVHAHSLGGTHTVMILRRPD